MLLLMLLLLLLLLLLLPFIVWVVVGCCLLFCGVRVGVLRNAFSVVLINLQKGAVARAVS